MSVSPMSCPLIPMDDRIVARPLPPDTLTGSGLHLVDTRGPTRAVVVAVGPGRRCDSGAVIPAPANVGDVVLLSEHGPTEIDVDGETLLCCPPLMVLAVVA